MVSLQNFLQLDDYNGVPLAAGKIYVYPQGRTELAEIYSDINGETPIANPAVLDDLGMQEIYVSNVYNYTVVVTDPYNNELFTRDIYPNGVDGGGNNRLYEGLDPICVNNEKLVISAKKATLSVQDPLYFVEDSQSAVCIGLQESAYSGLPYVENSAIELDPSGNISAISGHSFHSDSAESAGIVTDGWETGSDGRITAYNGTAFSAGKVYSGISPVYVNNESDLIGVSSKDFLANSPLYFTEYSDRVELSISGLPPTPGLMYESGFNYESGKITGYNGSGISAGKVYSGIDPVHVDNVNDTISLDSATLGVQAPLYFVEDSESATIIGLNTAQIQVDIPESANWNEAYSTVNNNSGNWNNKLDADIYAQDSGTFLTALPSDVVYTADIQDMATTGDINDLVTSIAETYQSTAGMTAYQTAGNYYSASNPSGFITGLPAGTMNESAFGYDSDNKISSYNGSALAGGSYQPSGNYIPYTAVDSLFNAFKTNSGLKITTSIGGGALNTNYINSNYITLLYIDSNLNINNQSVLSTGYLKFQTKSDSAYVDREKIHKWDSASDYIQNNSATINEVNTSYQTNSGTYLTAHQSLPQSADWNSTTATVSTNSGAWGGSGIEISAGFGIDIQMVDNKLLISLATATGDI